MTSDTDIVTRLNQGWAATPDKDARFVLVHKDEWMRCTDLTREAADEIRWLRKRLLAEENAYDIERRENEHLQTDRNNLLLRAEEAERMLGLYREWIGDEMLSAARKKAGL